MAAEITAKKPCGGRGRGRGGRALAYPVFVVLCNAYVVAQSMRAVGALRHKFSIKPPLSEPNDDMNEDEKMLWRRTYRAQTNCIEWFALTTPIFVGGAMVGKAAFGCYGKYVPRFLGACSILNAFFRYKYLKAYQKEADLRTEWFKWTVRVLQPALLVSMAACLHLIYKDARCVVKKFKKE